MQTARTSAFAPYTYRIFISESVGSIKPTAAFFDHVLRDLGCRPEECLMVGDSLSNDIRGAKAAGMDTCWYNPRGKAVPADAGADHVIGSIRELPDILEI
jgi:2-haloacid dehalogenase